jgi:hypothetical protein
LEAEHTGWDWIPERRERGAWHTWGPQYAGLGPQEPGTPCKEVLGENGGLCRVGQWGCLCPAAF